MFSLRDIVNKLIKSGLVHEEEKIRTCGCNKFSEKKIETVIFACINISLHVIIRLIPVKQHFTIKHHSSLYKFISNIYIDYLLFMMI